jgi:hypothetical protein
VQLLWVRSISFFLGGTQPVFSKEKNCLIKMLVNPKFDIVQNCLAYGRCMQLDANSMNISSETILLKVLSMEIDLANTGIS